MTSVACLRILLPDARPLVDPGGLAALVGKVGGTFLESRWMWPRRWGEIAPMAFALADPRTDRFEPGELQALSAELHRKLFGQTSAGEVRLLLLQGRQEDIMRFASAEVGLLRAMVEQGGASLNGWLSSITPSEIRALETLDSLPPYPLDAPALAEPSLDDLARTPPGEPGFRGVFHPPRHVFVGSVLVAPDQSGEEPWSVVDGLWGSPLGGAVAHDLACLAAAPMALARPGAIVFVPINYSAVVHASTRKLYEAALVGLPTAQRSRLAAAVYETPRDPTWSALGQMKTFLAPHFGLIDLQVSDPGFAIEKLPGEGVVTSVTFALPDAGDKERLLAAGRFMQRLPDYRRRRIWPGIANIRTRRELDACIALKAPFVTGRAVTYTLCSPPDTSPRQLGDLPLRVNPVATTARSGRLAG